MNYPRIIALLGATLLTGCGNVDSAHLVFGQQQVVGLDITASAPEQGASLSLGFKDKNIAVIPVAVKQGDGSYLILGGSAEPRPDASTATSSDSEFFADAYSTLGQFELDTRKGAVPSIGLGKFFATGLAARELAEGFKAKLSK